MPFARRKISPMVDLKVDHFCFYFERCIPSVTYRTWHHSPIRGVSEVRRLTEAVQLAYNNECLKGIKQAQRRHKRGVEEYGKKNIT